MSLPGDGFIALWNDIDPRRADYDAWHTTEHVPERMGVAGFLRAHRYVLSAGVLPKYFTLYALDALSALNSDSYKRLVQEPTLWTRGMRPDFRSFLRYVCRTVATEGAGVGGFAAVCLIQTLRLPRVREISETLASMEGVSSAHVGQIEELAERLELNVPMKAPMSKVAGVVVIEGYDAQALQRSCDTVTANVLQPLLGGWSFYQLAFEIRDVDMKRTPQRGTPR